MLTGQPQIPAVRATQARIPVMKLQVPALPAAQEHQVVAEQPVLMVPVAQTQRAARAIIVAAERSQAQTTQRGSAHSPTTAAARAVRSIHSTRACSTGHLTLLAKAGLRC